MDKPRRAIICLSGGMDSTALLLRLLAEGRRVFGLSFDYGQKHKLELERLKANIEYLHGEDIEFQHHVVEFPKLGTLFHSALTDSNWAVPTGHYEQENMKQTVVPNRNAIFSAIAFGYALSVATEADADVDLSLGVHSGDHAIYPDCRPEFYEAIFNAFAIGNWESDRVHLHLPYLHLDKTSILEDAAISIEKLGLDFDTIFRNTCTSYQPTREGKSHGLTGSDVERIIAFHQFGRPDPVSYVRPWETVVKEALRLERLHRQDSGVGMDD